MATSLSDWLDYMRARAEVKSDVGQALVAQANADTSTQYSDSAARLLELSRDTSKEINAELAEGAHKAGEKRASVLPPTASAADVTAAYDAGWDKYMATFGPDAVGYKKQSSELVDEAKIAFANHNKRSK